MSLILIADDDPNLRYSFQRMLDGRGYSFLEAANGREAVECVSRKRPDLVVMDIRMPETDGLTAFDEIKVAAPGLPVIIMTAYGTTDTAIEAMKQGAFDYILKPFDIDEMGALIARALRQADALSQGADVRLPEQDADSRSHELVGSSRAMQAIYKAIGQVSQSEVHVLILGDSGTGKELVARAIHRHSRRAERRFLAINCGAIPDTLIESELFGHEKGAYTGADTRKPGLLQRCDSGTAFLDEIGDLPLSSQVKLLRFLQEGEIIPIGADAPVRLGVRVVAATNKDLRSAVREKRFREDLFYRLDTMSIRMPPLTDRLEDLGELVAHFLHRFNREFDKGFSHIDSSTLEVLKQRPWPGNVRELENVVRKAVLTGQGTVLQPEHVGPAALSGAGDEADAVERGMDGSLELLVDRILDASAQDGAPPLIPTVERLLIARVLGRVGGNQVQAARLLGISRNTLRNRIDRYGLRPQEPRG
ncbi:sigma-54-dependent transcriptional regulator [Planctomycetota bacterium]